MLGSQVDVPGSNSSAPAIAGPGFVAVSSIRGGTGHYEGASGRFGTIADDAGGWWGFMRGEICAP